MDGSAARLWHRPPHRADQRRQARAQLWNLYPALLKLEQEGAIASEWGLYEKSRKAKFYKLTRAGRMQLENWQQTTAILDRFLSPKGEPA